MKVTGFFKEIIVGEEREFNSGHASTLVKLPNGDILAAWFGGSWEKGPDVAVWMSRRTKDGWQKPRVAAVSRGTALWNPVLFTLPDGRIALYYKQGETISVWKTMVKYSSDGGVTFSEAEELVPGDDGNGRGPVKNKPILLSNGTIAAPASLEGALWDSFVDLSSDGGKTWKKSELVPLKRMGFNDVHIQPDIRHCYGKGIIQPTLWESTPGFVHMFTRSTSSAIFRSDSTDYGKTWCCGYQSGLPNNNSGVDLVKLPKGGLVLAWNPNGNHPNYYKGSRTPLVLSYSADNGVTWETIQNVEDGKGCYAYPSIIADESAVHMTYTLRRETIAYCKLSYSE